MNSKLVLSQFSQSLGTVTMVTHSPIIYPSPDTGTFYSFNNCNTQKISLNMLFMFLENINQNVSHKHSKKNKQTKKNSFCDFYKTLKINTFSIIIKFFFCLIKLIFYFLESKAIKLNSEYRIPCHNRLEMSGVAALLNKKQTNKSLLSNVRESPI